MSTSEKRVLVVDDDANLLAGVTRVLRPACQVVTATSGAAALQCLEQEGPFAVVVSDYQMPGMDGVTFLRSATSRWPETVPIMLTGHAQLDLAIAAFQDARVFRFLIKPCPHDLLRATIIDCLEQHRLVLQERRLLCELREANTRLLERNQELTELSRSLSELNAALDRATRTDPLTGILNRRAWVEGLTLQLDLARRRGLVYAVTLVDVDEFKRYNDTLGHQAGDECLVRIAETIHGTCRTSDVCGRYGGEEFVLACLHDDPEGALIHAERIRRAVFDLAIPSPGDRARVVTVSIGYTVSGDDEHWESILRRADAALYAAKREGRNCVRTIAPLPAAGASPATASY